MDFVAIRKLAISAMVSDDSLLEHLVLKGGNAISLIYAIGSRGSLDVDFSMEADFPSVEEYRDRIFAALRKRFAMAGLVVFDEKFLIRPSEEEARKDPRWGGYRVEFKLIESVHSSKLRGESDQARREALVIGPGQRRAFGVDISKNEYCGHKQQTEIDNYAIYVYTPPMIVIEKLRAICQQMPEYERRIHPAPRAQDFYDIHALVSEARVDLTAAEAHDLAVLVFRAKDVPLRLMARIHAQREFHRPDWPAVQNSVIGDLRDYDFYFDFVVDQALLLKTLWEV